MAKQYATIKDENRYQEQEISYVDSWKKGNFFEETLERRRKNVKKKSVGEFMLNIFFDLIELALG